jgi:thiamine-phosphate pyrophosphorylase
MPELTPAAARALQSAQNWAMRHGAADVQPRHLLAGLVEEEEGRPAMLLAAAGLDGHALRRHLEAGVSAQAQPAEAPLPLHPLAHEALGEARGLAVELSGERAVPTEALLLAILRVDRELLATLAGLGLDHARLERDLPAPHGEPLTLDEPLELAEATDQVDTRRILDANANRAREALRVIEDYCRFSLDDAFLSLEAKQLRHDLQEALAGVPVIELLESRETQRDVGTAHSTRQELERDSLQGVVHANLKRLQEALRSLEEHGKLLDVQMVKQIEQIRYRSYTLERAVKLTASAHAALADCRLYVLLTASQCAASLEWTIQEAAGGGATMFQLREKNLSDRELCERARQVRRWTRKAGARFIMNDRPDIARLAEADGVHLGQDDMAAREARRILGPQALIGVSTHNLEQVREAVLDGASYIGVGPTFASGTKDFADLAGPEFVRQAVSETTLPAFVIGGVNLDTIDAAVAAGARRVAVSQAICQADDPGLVARTLLQRLS